MDIITRLEAIHRLLRPHTQRKNRSVYYCMVKPCYVLSQPFFRIVHELRPLPTCVRLHQPIALRSTPRVVLKDQVLADLITLLIAHESIVSVHWICLVSLCSCGIHALPGDLEP